MTGLKEVEILLVEDNPQDAEMTLRALKKRNLANNVHHAQDGAEALAFLFDNPTYSDKKPGAGLRMVLLDLKLPKVDGLEVLKKIKGDERTRMIPVVVMTSSREERDLVESYKLGVNSYIVKPVDFEKFLDSVQQLGLYWLLVNQTPR
jgi:two-component system response regulator